MIWNTPIKLGKYISKNRIAYPPISTNWGNNDGNPTNATAAYYRNQAKGGPGLIIVEGTAINIRGKGSSNSLVLDSRQNLSAFENIAHSITEEDCLSYIQLMHAGGQANESKTGFKPVNPSGVGCKSINSSPNKLLIKEIKNIINSFGDAAIIADNIGFKGVELHLSHGYLLHEFISRRTNLRTDYYGGKDIKSRFNIIKEIIHIIYQKTNLDIGLRVSGDDFIPDGIMPDDIEEISNIIKHLSPSYVHVTAGIYDSSDVKHSKMSDGYFFDLSEEFRRFLEVPVIGVGKVLSIEQAEGLLEKDKCDLVAIGRAQLADPNLVKNALANKRSHFCIECKRCMYLKYGKEMLKCPIRKKAGFNDEASEDSLEE